MMNSANCQFYDCFSDFKNVKHLLVTGSSNKALCSVSAAIAMVTR